MKKLLVMAVALASAMPMAVAQGPGLLKGPVPAAPLKDWLGDTSVQGPASEKTLVLNFALTISPDGAVVRCMVEASTGEAGLDAGACDLLVNRGRFQAATDGAGKAVMGVYRGTMIWAPQGAAPALSPIEVAVALQTMPAGLPDPAYVDLVVSTDETGRVDGCTTGEGPNWSGQPVPARVAAGKILGAVACGEALKGMKLDPAMNAGGKAVRSVQTARALFTAKPAVLAESSPSAEPASTAAADPDAPILVEGQSIITRPEAVVPYQGFHPFRDLTVIGTDVVLLEAEGDKFYRATLESYCFGTASLMQSLDPRIYKDDPDPPRMIVDNLELAEFLDPDERPPFQEGLAFVTHADGTFDRSSIFIARVIEPDRHMHVKRCGMISLVESEPPKGWKRSSRPAKAIKPPVPILPAVRPAAAPDGGRVYPVQWVERPTQDQLDKMSRGRGGSGWIMCQTAADNKVRNCRTVSKSPARSGVANQIKLASGSFRVRSPTVDGRPAVGAWVAIGFDFTPAAKRQTALKCDPSNKLDPC